MDEQLNKDCDKASREMTLGEYVGVLLATGFLFGSGLILAAMLFRAVLHTGLCS